MIYLVQPLKKNLVRVLYKTTRHYYSTRVYHIRRGQRPAIRVALSEYKRPTEERLISCAHDLDLLEHRVTYFGETK